MLLPVIPPVRPGFSALILSPEALSAQLQAACLHLPFHELFTAWGVFICETMAMSYEQNQANMPRTSVPLEKLLLQLSQAHQSYWQVEKGPDSGP